MGKRTAASTKGGRFVNPTDQARKDARRKELLKNRKQRQAVREAVIKAKDPEKIIEELMQTDQMQYNPRIECPFPEGVMEDRRKRLLTTYERIISFADKNKTNDAAKTSEYRKALSTYESNRRRLIADYHAVKLAEGTTVELLQALPTGVPLPEEEDVEPMFKFTDVGDAEASAFSAGAAFVPQDWHAKSESALNLCIRLSSSYEGKATGRLPGGPPPLPLPDMLRDEFISLSAAAISSIKDQERRERKAMLPEHDAGDEQLTEEWLMSARAARPYAAVPPPEFAGDSKDDHPVDPATGQPLPDRNEMYFNAHLNRQHARAGNPSASATTGSFPPRPAFVPPLPGTFNQPRPFMPMHAPSPYRQYPMSSNHAYPPMVRPPWPSSSHGPIPPAFGCAPAATITAQPQLKNLGKDVTKMVPTAVASHLRPGVKKPALSDGRPASVRMFTPQSALITSDRTGVVGNEPKPRLPMNLASNASSGAVSKSVDSAYQEFLAQMKGYI